MMSWRRSQQNGTNNVFEFTNLAPAASLKLGSVDPNNVPLEISSFTYSREINFQKNMIQCYAKYVVEIPGAKILNRIQASLNRDVTR